MKSHTEKCGNRVQPNALWTFVRNTFEIYSIMFSRVQRPPTLNIYFWCTGFATSVPASFHWLIFAYFFFTRIPWLITTSSNKNTKAKRNKMFYFGDIVSIYIYFPPEYCLTIFLCVMCKIVSLSFWLYTLIVLFVNEIEGKKCFPIHGVCWTLSN